MHKFSASLRRTSSVVLALLLSCMALHADAQWKWRDKDGRVTISDRPPPPDVVDKDILARPVADQRRALAATAASSTAAGASAPLQPAKGPLERELDARKRAAEQEQAAKAKGEETRLAAVRADNCRRARSQLAALDSGQRIARVNDKGEREIMDDRARAEELRQVRDVMASDCR